MQPSSSNFPQPQNPVSSVEVLPDPALRWLKKECRYFNPETEKQARAMDCTADILLLGGAAGSLKTSTMLADAIAERDYSRMRSYFFRRTYAELEGGDGAIDQSRRLFSQVGATYNASSHTWKFPAGGEFYFRHAQHEKDVYQYQGHAMSALAIDESTHWPESMVRYLITRNRSTDLDFKVRVRLGTNPGNIGHKWHQKLFLAGVCPHCQPQLAPPQWHWHNEKEAVRWDGHWPSDGSPLEITLDDGRKVPISISYILSTVREHNLYPASYLARLKMQSPATAKALLEGCWKIFEGQFFDVWEPFRGIAPGTDPADVDWREALKMPPGLGPMVVPRRAINEQWWWPRWVSSDYGFSVSSTTGHLFLHEPQSQRWPRGRIFVADELECQETAKNFADLLLSRWVLGDDRQPIEYRWMPWYLSPDSFREIGVGFTLAKQMNDVLNRYNLGFSKADNDRVGGAMKIYSGLESGELVICAECKSACEALESRIHDPDHENDVLKVSGDPLDDHYDDLRYGYKSFETARDVSTPFNVRVTERLEKEFKADPTTAMFNAMKTLEQEKAKEAPEIYGGSVRARLRRAEKGKRPDF